MAILSPLPKMQFLSAAGVPLVSGQLFTYLAGTTTPATTYTTASGGAANTNPIILDSRGEANVWLTNNVSYKFVLKTSVADGSTTIWTVDSIVPLDASGVANWLTTVVGTNTYDGLGAPQFDSYVAGQVFRFVVPNTNTSTTGSSLQVNGKGYKTIKRANGTDMAPGDLVLGATVEVVYDGTYFKMNGLPGTLVVDDTGIVIAEQFQSTSAFSGPGDQFKNKIINGGFIIDQRNGGAVQSINSAVSPGSALVYTVDRFYVSAMSSAGTPAITVQRGSFGSGSTRNKLVIIGNTNVTNVVLGTRLEAKDVNCLAGKTVTISVNMSRSSGATVDWALYYPTSTDSFGTIAAPTRTLIGSGTFTGVGNLANPFATTVAIPAAAIYGLELTLSSGALGNAVQWELDELCLEEGSAATPYAYPPFATEVAQCQRFYCKTFDLDTKPAQNTSAPGTIGLYTQTANTTFGYGWRFPVPMRTTPSALTFYNPSAANANWSGGGVGVTTVDAGSAGVTLAGAGPTIAAGARTSIHATADAEL